MHGMYSTWHVEFFFSFRFHNFIFMNFVMEKNLRIVEESRTWTLFVEEEPHRWGVISSISFSHSILFAKRYLFFARESILFCFFLLNQNWIFLLRVCALDRLKMYSSDKRRFLLVSNTVWSHFSHQFMMFCVQWIFNLASQQRKRNDNHLSNDSQPKENHENWYCSYEKEI